MRRSALLRANSLWPREKYGYYVFVMTYPEFCLTLDWQEKKVGLYVLV